MNALLTQRALREMRHIDAWWRELANDNVQVLSIWGAPKRNPPRFGP